MPSVPDQIQGAVRNAINGYQEIADAHNQQVRFNYDAAFANAKSNTDRGFPAAFPGPVMLWSVNILQVQQAYQRDADPALFEHPFVEVPYVPTPAPVRVAPDLKVKQADQQLPGYFELEGDSPKYPPGYRHGEGGHVYVKTLVSYSPFSQAYPNGEVYEWLQVS
jgi:hypothetical protein